MIAIMLMGCIHISKTLFSLTMVHMGTYFRELVAKIELISAYLQNVVITLG